MTARTVVETLSGATLLISAALPATYDAAGYAAISAGMTAVGQVENFNDHGMTAVTTPFTPVATGIVNKVKGAKDYGTLSPSIGHMPGDAGQVILTAASESAAHYSVKLLYPDGGAHYLDVLVTKYVYTDGATSDVQKVACDMSVCRAPVIVNP